MACCRQLRSLFASCTRKGVNTAHCPHAKEGGETGPILEDATSPPLAKAGLLAVEGAELARRMERGALRLSTCMEGGGK